MHFILLDGPNFHEFDTESYSAFEGVFFPKWMPSNTDLDFGDFYGKENPMSRLNKYSSRKTIILIILYLLSLQKQLLTVHKDF